MESLRRIVNFLIVCFCSRLFAQDFRRLHYRSRAITSSEGLQVCTPLESLLLEKSSPHPLFRRLFSRFSFTVGSRHNC